jgi:transposase
VSNGLSIGESLGHTEGVARDPRDVERIAELEAVVRQQEDVISELMGRVRKLEEQLGRNSSNSNQPPSRDTPEQRRDREKTPPSGRKPGGQPGHKPQRREMLPPQKVSHIEDHHPHECAQCGSSLPLIDDPNPLRHQVVDVPEIRPDVTEHRLHATECEECGHRARALLPTGVPRSMFGPRLLALIALLTGASRVSRRQAVTFLGDVLGSGCRLERSARPSSA